LALNQPEKALPDAEKLIEEQPENYTYLALRGRVQQARKAMKKACEDWKTGAEKGNAECKELMNKFCK
jgi:predicted Zn-dependent protease